jgi:hypothetical protein
MAARILHERALRQPVHLRRMHGDAGERRQLAAKIADAARIAEPVGEGRADRAVIGVDADGGQRGGGDATWGE